MVRKTLWITEDNYPSDPTLKNPSRKYQYLEVKVFGPIFLILTLGIIAAIVYIKIGSQDEDSTVITTGRPPVATTTPSQPPVATTTPSQQAKAERVAAALSMELQGVQGPEGVKPPSVEVKSFSNWDGRVSRQALVSVAPESLEQVKKVVKAVNKVQEKEEESLKYVVPRGGGYSYTDLYAGEGQVSVDSSGLTSRADESAAIKLITDHPQANGTKLLSVLAGITVGEMVDAMVDLGVQVPSLTVIINAQIAGSIASGSHGGKGVMSEHVFGLTLVDGAGEVQEYNEVEHPAEMASLRCCVGMCGIFYEIIFRVEEITHVSDTHYWKRASDVVQPEFIQAILSQGSYLGHWAPLSSWTDEDWANYSSTGTVPQNYEPWNDLIWYNTKAPVEVNQNARRRRRSVGPLPPLLGGGLSYPQLERMRRQAEGEGTTPSTDEPVTEPEPPVPIDTNLMLHKAAIDAELIRTAEINNTEETLPEALSSYNATGAFLIQEIGFTLGDNTSLTYAKKFYDIVFASLKKSVLEKGKMPVLTLVSRWLNPAKPETCHLCPNNFPATYGDDTLVFTCSFTTFAYKPSYMEWLSELLPQLSKEFPMMRIRWAYADPTVPGLISHMKASLASDIGLFNTGRNSANKAGNSANQDKFVSGFMRNFVEPTQN